MTANDLVLLDSLLQKAKGRLEARLDDGELFEFFAFEQLLKEYDLAYDEIESGWVDSTDDGGIDGFFSLLDGHLLQEPPDPSETRRGPAFEVWIIAAKHSSAFKQPPLNSLIGSLPELFDLRLETHEIKYPFPNGVLDARELFKTTYVGLADKAPQLSIRIVYASRGDSATLADNVRIRAVQLEQAVRQLFTGATVSVSFAGASELLALARREKSYALRLAFVENPISRTRYNYLVLSRLVDYYRFVTDDNGKLRRYLFDANVRDYLGPVQVNKDIRLTLQETATDQRPDFWWLNNGVTLLATQAVIAGKELSLENVQIVNGLQTTETIYRHFQTSPVGEDDRAILIKILITGDDEARDRIIKATNYQNAVALASLHATDKIQRDIEQFLADHGWFYERRHNMHQNQGRPASRIVSISYLGAAVRAILLRRPQEAVRQKTRWMREEAEYRRVFNDSWPLAVYLACLEIVKAAERIARDRRVLQGLNLHSTQVRQLRYLVALVYVANALGRREYKPADLVPLARPHDPSELLPSLAFVAERAREFGRRATTAGRDGAGGRFADHVLELLASSPKTGPAPPLSATPPSSTSAVDQREGGASRKASKPWWRRW